MAFWVPHKLRWQARLRREWGDRCRREARGFSAELGTTILEGPTAAATARYLVRTPQRRYQLGNAGISSAAGGAGRRGAPVCVRKARPVDGGGGLGTIWCK